MAKKQGKKPHGSIVGHDPNHDWEDSVNNRPLLFCPSSIATPESKMSVAGVARSQYGNTRPTPGVRVMLQALDAIDRVVALADRPPRKTRRLLVCMKASRSGFAGPSTVTTVVRRALD
jgi:hypothetical protein